jgi:hypothetical protein
MMDGVENRIYGVTSYKLQDTNYQPVAVGEYYFKFTLINDTFVLCILYFETCELVM